MRKLNKRLLAVLREAPAARVSRGCISVGNSQQMGPHDLHAHPQLRLQQDPKTLRQRALAHSASPAAG